jgi:hypothetical protein
VYETITDSGLISLNTKSAELIMKRFYFIEGSAYIRDGMYLQNKQLQFVLHGVYDIQTGHFHMYLNPPHLVLAQVKSFFNDSNAQIAYDIGMKARIIKLINQQLDGRKVLRDDLTNKCIYKGFMNVEPIPVPPPSEDDYYTQYFATKVNQLLVQGELQALNCNSTIAVKAETWVIDTLYSRSVNYTVLVTIFAFIEALALVYQMAYSRTQSGASRISLLSIGQQALLDCYLCLMHLTLGIFIEGVFKVFATAAFLKFVLFSIFEMRYLIHIWKARRPQGFTNGFEVMRRELQSLYMRFYGALFVGLIVIYQFTSFFQYFVLILFSFWLPQIYCNATRNAPKPMTLVYIIVMSITRLFVPLYLFGCPRNIIGIQPNPILCVVLILWVFVQAVVLVSQYFLGPRWFIPKMLLPPKYDYKRPIPAELLEDPSCVVCMSDIDSSEAVVTPCNHVFHAQCLARWMEEKMECPTCRTIIPEM